MKTKRWIALLMALVLCASLCGCARLDEMQAAHAIWVDDHTISWNGYEYTLLEGYWTDLNLGVGALVYLTDADVPTLLITRLGERVSVNNSGTLLSYYAENGQKVFCRSDLTAWLDDAFINGYELEMFQYEYWDTDTGLYCAYTLTPEQMVAVQTVLDTVDSFAVEEYYPSDKDSVTLYGYSTYGLFVEDMGWIDCIDGMYYIFRENDYDGYGWNIDCYIVPDEYYDVFSDILVGREMGVPIMDESASIYPPKFFI